MARKFDPVRCMRREIWRKGRQNVLAMRKQISLFAELALEESVLEGTSVDFAKEIALQHFAEAWSKGERDWKIKTQGEFWPSLSRSRRSKSRR